MNERTNERLIIIFTCLTVKGNYNSLAIQFSKAYSLAIATITTEMSAFSREPFRKKKAKNDKKTFKRN